MSAEEPPLETETGIRKAILDKLEKIAIHTRPKPTSYFEAVADQVFYSEKHRPDKPVFSWRNRNRVPTSLKRVDIIFNDEIDENHKPHVFIQIAGINIFKTLNEDTNPFIAADLTLDLKEGVTVPPGRDVEIFIYHTGADNTEKSASILTSFGGL